ncbi:hypothetical protein PHYPO_G00030240 [Pangasianodon hypophthalmus]|uniref:Uncharacterized protein n=1 Tax=Pangasianodon hypophthalmus TaxID=310915 RepID=A0A5N5MJH7_PANHP|nr:hypothetical protein PHYPO_G00030240 [Pangasianodon hypophthalmus]
MTPPKEETSQEKFKREKKREGWDPGEPRHASDPEEPAGLKDSVTGRHVAQNSLQESDPETSASLPPVPDTSPPSGPAEACHMFLFLTSGGWSNISETEKCQHRPYTQRDKEYTIT